jgi:hypothetical protein
MRFCQGEVPDTSWSSEFVQAKRIRKDLLVWIHPHLPTESFDLARRVVEIVRP